MNFAGGIKKSRCILFPTLLLVLILVLSGCEGNPYKPAPGDYSISGQLTGVENVEGITVNIYREEEKIDETQTEDNGFFQFEDVEEGNYYLEIPAHEKKIKGITIEDEDISVDEINIEDNGTTYYLDKPIELRVKEVEAEPGEEITVPITVDIPEDAGSVGSYVFNLEYDETVLEYNGVEAGEILLDTPENYPITEIDDDQEFSFQDYYDEHLLVLGANEIECRFFSEEEIEIFNGSGVMFELKFTVSDAAETGISDIEISYLRNFYKPGGNESFLTKGFNGGVKIDGASPGQLPASAPEVNVETDYKEISLDWENVDYTGEYILEYGTSPGEYSEEITLYKTNYTLQDMDPEETYYIRVTARNEEGEKTSEELTATPVKIETLEITDASAGNEKIRLEFNEPLYGYTTYPQDEDYIIKYGTSPDSYTDSFYIDENKTDMFVFTSLTIDNLKNGEEYYFTAAKVVNGREGENSNVVSATPKENTDEELKLNIETVKAGAGELVEVPIYMENIWKGLSTYEFFIEFDNEILTLKETENGDINPYSPWSFSDLDEWNEDGEIPTVYMDLTDNAEIAMVENGGHLGTLTFQIKDEAEDGFTELTIKNEDEEDINLSAWDGTQQDYSIENGGIEIDDSGILVIPEITDHNSGDEKIRLHFDEEIYPPAEDATYYIDYGTEAGEYTEEIVFDEAEDKHHQNVFTSYTIDNLNNEEEYHFAVRKELNNGREGYSQEYSASPEKEAGEDLELTVNTVEASPGDTVTVPIEIENIWKGIFDYNLSLDFDNEILKLTDENAGEIHPYPDHFLIGSHNYDRNNEEGYIQLSYEDPEDFDDRDTLVEREGTLACLEFEIAEEAESTNADITINTEETEFNCWDGTQLTPIQKNAGGVEIMEE